MSRNLIGRIAIVAVLAFTVLGGALLYYLQVFAYYDRVAPGDFTLQTPTGTMSAEAANIEAIDSGTSPIRFRACFDTTLPVQNGATPYDEAEPLNAPFWFDCFDAGALTSALEDGTARAYLAERNVRFGADRVVAITRDGRGYVWHQLNQCSDPTMAGVLGPEVCPPPEDD